MVYKNLNGIENKRTVKYPYPNGIKNCDILIIDTQMVLKRKKDNSKTTVVISLSTGNEHLQYTYIHM